MNVEELVIKLEDNTDIETGYMLLPYIKVDEEQTLLNTQINNDSILYVPLVDGLRNPEYDTVDINHFNEPNILTDHNYHNNMMNDTSKCVFYSLSEENNIKRQQCTYCNKILANPAALVRHLRIHTGEQPFQCQLCSKRFTQQSNLWKHVLIHTGERKFECDYCDKKFSQRANMEKHLRIHTGEKPYQCTICQRGFTQRANLKKHQRTHTGEKPYSCKYCDRQFTQLSNKQKHEILHNGIKPYTCPICLVPFAQQSNLKKHLLTHNSTEKFHTCQTCNKTYFKKKNFLKHKEECSACQQMQNKTIKKSLPTKSLSHKEDNFCAILLADE